MKKIFSIIVIICMAIITTICLVTNSTITKEIREEQEVVDIFIANEWYKGNSTVSTIRAEKCSDCKFLVTVTREASRVDGTKYVTVTYYLYNKDTNEIFYINK